MLSAGYCYVVSIDLEMYRYPLPDLVEHVRTALTKLKVSRSCFSHNFADWQSFRSQRRAEQAALDAQLEDLEISPRARRPDEAIDAQ